MKEDCGPSPDSAMLAERANLPMPGQAHLLTGSVLELHKMMEQYVSFSNNIILGSVALLQGFFGSQTSFSRDTLPTSTNVPSEEVTMEEIPPIRGPLEESTMPLVPHGKQAKMKAPPNWFPSWEKVLHPSQLVTTMGQAHWLLVNQSKGTATRGLRQGELNTKGQKSGCKQSWQNEIHPHLSLQNQCMWWPACKGTLCL